MKTQAFLCFMILVLWNNSWAIEYREAQVAGKNITVCQVQIQTDKLQLFLRDDAEQPLKSLDHLARWLGSHGQKLVFAMNAGMFQSDLSPVGLFVSDGKQIHPLNTDKGTGNFYLKPNGVFCVTETGAHIVNTSAYPKLHKHVILATQSGPLLVYHGKIHPAFQPDSPSRFVRNGVGVLSSDIVIFAMSEVPVNFYEFATFFRDTLKCSNALYLDGNVSSLYSKQLQRNDFKVDLGPMIGVVE